MTEHDSHPPGGSNPGSVSLGCGTLILIAIIVAMFSGSSRVSSLESKVSRMRNTISSMDRELSQLNRKIDRLIELVEKK